MNKYDSFVHVSELVKLQEENKKLKISLLEHIELVHHERCTEDYDECGHGDMIKEFNIE